MRVQGTCIGDCSKCELLSAGEVDMIPCILDQIFQRVRKNEVDIQNILEVTSEKKEVKLIGNEEE